ncbi:MAG: Stp1/IreP family PP2C-type Ser/Thr phosphatase [Butyricicoccus sp.]
MNVYGKTDRGLVRSNNQDTYRTELNENGCTYLILCDGMGGARAGNVASEKTADIFLDYLRQNVTAELDTESLARVILQGSIQANREVFEMAQSSPDYSGMGTTLVGGVAIEDRVLLCNIGDSRAYLIDTSRAAIAQMTEDHSLVEEMVRAGRLTKEEARHYPGRNLITRAVGVDETVEADLYEILMKEGQVLLLCSDGLSGMITDAEIAAIIVQSPDLKTAGDLLVQRACEAGGNDNITVVLYTK